MVWPLSQQYQRRQPPVYEFVGNIRLSFITERVMGMAVASSTVYVRVCVWCV